MTTPYEKLKNCLVDFTHESKKRLTPLAIEKHFLSKHPELSKKIFDQLLRELIAERALSYTYELGSSFLEASFDRPVRISDYVIIKPARQSFSATKNDIVITLQIGSSFGSGRHPSTRLAIRAMESILLQSNMIKDNDNLTALDIGTGSGVLAIAAVLMGIKKAIGLDIDPCARSEAKQNIYLNQLDDRIIIDHRPFKSIQEEFFLVLANLRFPTLADSSRHISDILMKEGFAVFSGLKTEEIVSIEKIYEKENMKSADKFTEKDWASIVFFKTG